MCIPSVITAEVAASRLECLACVLVLVGEVSCVAVIVDVKEEEGKQIWLKAQGLDFFIVS